MASNQNIPSTGISIVVERNGEPNRGHGGTVVPVRGSPNLHFEDEGSRNLADKEIEEIIAPIRECLAKLETILKGRIGALHVNSDPNRSWPDQPEMHIRITSASVPLEEENPVKDRVEPLDEKE